MKFFKKILPYFKSAPSFSYNCKISRKKSRLNLGQKITYLAFLSWNFKKLISIFEISTLKFVNLVNFSKKKKKKKKRLLKLWSESPFFGYFSSRITKKSCYIWNQDPLIFLAQKLHKKQKMPYFVTKNSWLVFFFDQKSLIWVF